MIFVGKVLAIKRLPVPSPTGGQYLRNIVSLEVFESFRGAPVKSVTVSTGIGGGDCGFPFKVGGDYLVYTSADGTEQTQSTSICARTKPVGDSKEDLEFLHSLVSKGPEGKIFGYVGSTAPPQHSKPVSDNGSNGRIPGVSVRLESLGRQWITVTDSLGEYAFADLMPGPYRLWAELPGKLGGGEALNILLSSQACRFLPFITKELGSIAGVVHDGSGQPAKHVWVELIRASDQEPSGIDDGFTDEEGRYQIRRVPEGKYLMGVHVRHTPTGSQYLWMPFERSYYPGVRTAEMAEVIAVDSGQPVAVADWRLGLPLQKRIIRGIVLGPDEKPASPVFVELKAEGYEDNADLAETKSDGKFALGGLAGITYFVQASSGWREGSQAWHCHRTVVPNNDEPFTIRLNRPGKDCEECRKQK